MTRPSYKKLYLAEKHRRELYERFRPDLIRMYEEYQATLEGVAKGIETAILMGSEIKHQRTMKGLINFITE